MVYWHIKFVFKGLFPCRDITLIAAMGAGYVDLIDDINKNRVLTIHFKTDEYERL